MHAALRQEGAREEGAGQIYGALGKGAAAGRTGRRPAIALAAAFVVVLALVAHDALVSIDAPVARFLTRHHEPWLTSLVRVLTSAGSMAVVAPVALVAGLILRRTRDSWQPLVVLAASIAGGSLLCTLIKVVVSRPRPDDALFEALGYGFPSGHSTNAVTAWLTLAVLLGAASTSRAHRVALLAAAVLTAAIVGLTRVYLRVHEATDVVGGWALGGLWVAVVLTVAWTVSSRRGA